MDNTLVTINQEFYPNTYAWRIVSLTETELVVKRELTEQEEDHRELIDLYSEIVELQLSVTCTNASDWAFTAYGSKACGGPQGYIPYSTQIDAQAFLEKVEAYNNLENEFNIKWSVVSTCDIPSQPIGVDCQNGYAILKY